MLALLPYLLYIFLPLCKYSIFVCIQINFKLATDFHFTSAKIAMSIVESITIYCSNYCIAFATVPHYTTRPFIAKMLLLCQNSKLGELLFLGGL